MELFTVEDILREYGHSAEHLPTEGDGFVAYTHQREATVPEAAVSLPHRLRRTAVWVDVLFYGLLAALLVGLWLWHRTGSGYVFGYTGYTVLSGSMQREIPKGSFVLVKRVAPETLQAGDAITFVVEGNATVTHRIVTVFENIDGTGGLAFQTKGVENREPDAQPVYPENIVGRVVFHSLWMGRAIAFVQINWHVMALMAGLLVGLTVILKALRATPRQRR